MGMSHCFVESSLKHTKNRPLMFSLPSQLMRNKYTLFFQLPRPLRYRGGDDILLGTHAFGGSRIRTPDI